MAPDNDHTLIARVKVKRNDCLWCVDDKKCFLSLKIVSMLRKYHNHKLQTNLWHCEEEPHNNHETPERQTKQSNQLFLPHLDDYKTRMDTKYHTTKHRTITESHNGSNNQQRINNNRTTTLELTAAKATGGLICILLVPNLRPRFFFVEAQKC